MKENNTEKKCRKNGSANILNRVKVDVVTSYVKD